MKIFKLLILLNLFAALSARSNHTISKRSLVFPPATVLQFTYGLSVPLILPSRAINFSLCLQVNYNMPSNVASLQPKIVQRQGGENFDLSRETFYTSLIVFLENFGLDGEECLYRLICEISEIPMHLEQNENLLEQVVHFVFTPSLELTDGNNTSFNKKLLEAESFGRTKKQCGKKYAKCLVPLVNLFTAEYSI